MLLRIGLLDLSRPICIVFMYGNDYSFLVLQITISDMRPHVKFIVSVVIAEGFVWIYIWVNILTLSPLRIAK